MKLLIHLGTEKTGSSYLQKLCGKNRKFLMSNRIWFPDAGKHEKRLQKGTISPGNASELAGHIRDLEWVKVSSWLTARVKEAQTRGCASLLLSHELLFAALSAAGAVNQFQAAALEAGISKSRGILIIRDPIDQAVSLYKHRAKNGNIGEIDEWLSEDYFLPKQLSAFLGQTEQNEFQVHLRKYRKESESIETAFFHDWLEVGTPPIRIEDRVNPSLSLSELAVIRHVVQSRPADQAAFYSNFLSVSVEEKADDGDVQVLATKKVENYLRHFNEFWQELDVRLASDGGLKLPRENDLVEASVPKYVFSEAQLGALARAHTESLKASYAVNHWLNSSLRPLVGRLIRKFVPGFRRG